ncbi:MAG: hypothetical protein R2848_17645 [Thermomicrobiales bacterium]
MIDVIADNLKLLLTVPQIWGTAAQRRSGATGEFDPDTSDIDLIYELTTHRETWSIDSSGSRMTSKRLWTPGGSHPESYVRESLFQICANKSRVTIYERKWSQSAA